MSQSQTQTQILSTLMDQRETLLPLSSQSPTPTPAIHSPADAASSNPETGTSSSTVCTRKPHSNYSPTPILRLATILSLLLLSLWANYEASKGFDLTILNAPSRTLAGRRFNLFFVSNGRAADMALKSSSFIKRIIYSNGGTFPRKHVRHVTIRLADRNITNDVVVSHRHNQALVLSGEYLIEISPAVMMHKDGIKAAFTSALHRGMAYVWLWESHGSVPQAIIDAVVEYLSAQYNLPPKHYRSAHKTSTIAGIIQQCEERNNGFVARLNNALRGNWDPYAVTDAFTSPSDIMCLSRIISAVEDLVFPDVSGLKPELNQAM